MTFISQARKIGIQNRRSNLTSAARFGSHFAGLRNATDMSAGAYGDHGREREREGGYGFGARKILYPTSQNKKQIHKLKLEKFNSL